MVERFVSGGDREVRFFKEDLERSFKYGGKANTNGVYESDNGALKASVSVTDGKSVVRVYNDNYDYVDMPSKSYKSVDDVLKDVKKGFQKLASKSVRRTQYIVDHLDKKTHKIK